MILLFKKVVLCQIINDEGHLPQSACPGELSMLAQLIHRTDYRHDVKNSANAAFHFQHDVFLAMLASASDSFFLGSHGRHGFDMTFELQQSHCLHRHNSCSE